MKWNWAVCDPWTKISLTPLVYIKFKFEGFHLSKGFIWLSGSCDPDSRWVKGMERERHPDVYGDVMRFGREYLRHLYISPDYWAGSVVWDADSQGCPSLWWRRFWDNAWKERGKLLIHLKKKTLLERVTSFTLKCYIRSHSTVQGDIFSKEILF